MSSQVPNAEPSGPVGAVRRRMYGIRSLSTGNKVLLAGAAALIGYQVYSHIHNEDRRRAEMQLQQQQAMESNFTNFGRQFHDDMDDAAGATKRLAERSRDRVQHARQATDERSRRMEDVPREMHRKVHGFDQALERKAHEAKEGMGSWLRLKGDSGGAGGGGGGAGGFSAEELEKKKAIGEQNPH